MGLVPYVGRMTFLTNPQTQGAGIPITIRHRLRIAREEMYPDLPIAAFSKEILGVGKNMAAAYESKNGTRIENMKDMVLNKWAEVCNVSVEWLKGELPAPDPENLPEVTVRLIASEADNLIKVDFSRPQRAA